MNSTFMTFGDGQLFFNTGVPYQPYENVNEVYIDIVEDGSGDAGIPLASNDPMAIVDDANNNNRGDGDLNYGNDNYEEDVDDMAPTYEGQATREFVVQPETVFVTRMNQTVSKHDIEILFSRAGEICVDDFTGKARIFAYKNKHTGKSRGEATVTYINAEAAQVAIKWLDSTFFFGNKIRVFQAYVSYDGDSVRYDYIHEKQPQVHPSRKKVWRPAPDNWTCTCCRNSNFSWRTMCNRCQGDRGQCELAEGDTLTHKWRQNKSNWQCSYCQNWNFWHRRICNRCQSPKDEVSDLEQREVNYGNAD